jgi:anti-sigma factor RsiW
MVSGTHPDEIQLLDYVEDDLDTASRGVVEAHVAGCAECAEQIGRLEAGREALRGAPMLEAPERIRPELPERAAARGFNLRPRRLVAVLAPVAVVAGVVAIVATTNPGGGDEADEAGRAAATMAAQAEEGGAEEGAPAQPMDAAVVRSVAGPPSEVVRLLSQKGLEARRADDRVEVSGATPQQVEVALAHRPNGPVQVVAVP